MTIQDLEQKLSQVEVKNTILYFITRVLKSDIRRQAKVLDKYNFKVYQIDIDDEIRKHLYDLSIDKLAFLVSKELEIHEYDTVADDTMEILTYSMKNKAMSFADVVSNQLKNFPPKIQNLESIVREEELWAYCIGFHNKIDDEENTSTEKKVDWIYTFRKITASKVAIDENDNNKGKGILKAIRTKFNTKSNKLEIIEGQTINLDKQIDCIFYDDLFYVIKKGFFEQIVGIEEEFKAKAQEAIISLTNTGMIEGLHILAEQINSTPSIHRKLAKLHQLGNHINIKEKDVKVMAKVCKKHKIILNVKDGKLIIENQEDIDLVLKMLGDYYKLGEVSGKPYGTFAGKQLVISKD